MADFKVLSETGVILEGADDTVRAMGEILDLDPENEQVKVLVENGSIEAVVEEAGTSEGEGAGESAAGEGESAAEEAAGEEGDASTGEDEPAVAGDTTPPGERHPLA